ncbi:hypothetical protein TELCIR_13939 [Teladorsagia circumcincta]|uniref:Uncharacterized protein n=1 Tax=Teladorsagia circumcincta TaxID=45464 RepID=A0A2G9U2L7_TELCI|nr:hypothetical protein TELCIR_13939 [Teladorsagia circumcincta]
MFDVGCFDRLLLDKERIRAKTILIVQPWWNPGLICGSRKSSQIMISSKEETEGHQDEFADEVLMTCDDKEKFKELRSLHNREIDGNSNRDVSGRKTVTNMMFAHLRNAWLHTGNVLGGVAAKEIWQKMADDLAAEAVRRRCGDNVSVILLRLHE